MAITSKSVGIDQATLIKNITKSSILPPKYPETLPKKIPIINEMKTAMNPIKKEILEPTKTRLRTSLP